MSKSVRNANMLSQSANGPICSRRRYIALAVIDFNIFDDAFSLGLNCHLSGLRQQVAIHAAIGLQASYDVARLDHAYCQGQAVCEQAVPQTAHGLQIDASMSGRAICWDNASTESPFKTLEVERMHQQRYFTRADIRLEFVNWIGGFYDLERLYSSNGYQSPVDSENSLWTAFRLGVLSGIGHVKIRV